MQEARREAAAAAEAAEHASGSESDEDVPELDEEDDEDDEEEEDVPSDSDEDSDAFYSADEVDEDDDGETDTSDSRIKVLSVLELEELFTKSAPDLSSKPRISSLPWLLVMLTVSSVCRCQWKSANEGYSRSGGVS